MSKKIKIYAECLEETALAQFNSAMEQEFSVKGALMPDAHTGYSLPIGAVVATDEMIIPSWVGFDIGCGMCALSTSFNPDEIHRKGATHAENGMMGVIPGNMRDGSFIVKGKGNPDSLFSSSHGAGRVMGRKKAKQELSTSEFQATMQGIVALVGESTLDESPMAYKNIFEVMRLQADLVDVIHHVKPIINVKG